MKHDVIRVSRFESDLAVALQYFPDRDAVTTATRFLTAIENTIQNIERSPDIGIRVDSFMRPQRKVRLRPIRGFRNYMIAFRLGEQGIIIMRLLHGRQDIHRLLDE